MTMIQLKGVGLSFPHKTCFTHFNGSVEAGQRIAIIGDNGSGKSSLLRMLNGELEPSDGTIQVAPGVGIGYLKQVLDDATGLGKFSGGERVNHALSGVLANASAHTLNLLLLDEPTNHLDARNRRSLIRMLQGYVGSIILVTHDQELMNQVCDTIWCIERDQVTIFAGRYADYLEQQQRQRGTTEKKLAMLKRAQQDAHEALMKEQQRASHARQRGAVSIKNRKWATIKSPTKLGRGNTTAGKKQAEIHTLRRDLIEQLKELPSADIIQPHFHLENTNSSQKVILHINDGALGYGQLSQPIIKNLHLSLEQGERLAVVGPNGSGKSTLARAIAHHPNLIQSGEWMRPAAHEIGYLDQHYANLNPSHSVLQTLKNIVPDWTSLELRRHLSDFLFRHNDLVNSPTDTLSGGEKARLSLACIAARPPKLLILDELTNNLDLTMRQHMIEILRHYPGTLIVISHDDEFLCEVGGVLRYELKNCRLG